MKFKDEKTGIEIDALVIKERVEVQKRDNQGKKRAYSLIHIGVSIAIDKQGSSFEGRITGESRQHPNDVYNQLTGKRLAFGKVLNKIRSGSFNGSILINTKRIRTAIWRIGEVYAGIRNKDTVFIDLPE